jgi:hypothetical protein
MRFRSQGREASGLVTSPCSAFDDISVGSGNSASNYSTGAYPCFLSS